MYVESRKMVQMNPFAGIEMQTGSRHVETWGGGGGSLEESTSELAAGHPVPFSLAVQ